VTHGPLVITSNRTAGRLELTYGRVDRVFGFVLFPVVRTLGRLLGSRLACRLSIAAGFVLSVALADSTAWLVVALATGCVVAGIVATLGRDLEHEIEDTFARSDVVSFSVRLVSAASLLCSFRALIFGFAAFTAPAWLASPHGSAGPGDLLYAVGFYACTCVQARRPSKLAARFRAALHRPAFRPAGVPS
jgi:hypothetical protein